MIVQITTITHNSQLHHLQSRLSLLIIPIYFPQKTVLDSITADDPTFTGDGYISLAIIYAVFAICNWLAPPVISLTGPRCAMLIGAVAYW
jgi:Ion channel regulatory protein UNC-93